MPSGTRTRLSLAAHWFAVGRRRVTTLEEGEAYQHWLLDPANRAALAEMERLWVDIERVPMRSAAVAHNSDASSCYGLRKMMIATVCAVSLVSSLLCFFSESPFWNSLDWATR